MSNGDRTGHWITLAIGILTILVTIAASIPAFVALNQNRADVYWQLEEVSVLNPASPDYKRLVKVLQENQIPEFRILLKLTNTGNGPAEEVKIGIAVDGSIHEVITTPSVTTKPAWVELPNDLAQFMSKEHASFSIRSLATTKILAVDVSYFPAYSDRKLSPNVDVFFDGKPAGLIGDVTKAPRWTLFSQFRYPLYILGGGLVLVILVSTLIVINRNQDLGEAMLELGYKVAKMTLRV